MESGILQDLLELLIKVSKKMDTLDDKVERALRVKNCLDGDTLMDNGDMCRLLGVTKRTLQRYRQLRLIKYYLIEGKTLYKSSEVAEFINKFEVGVARKKNSPLYESSKNKE